MIADIVRYKPKYLNPDCDQCQKPLQLLSLVEDPNCSEEDLWLDEFWCINCQDGIHMDWPQDQIDAFKADVQYYEAHSEELIPYEEVRKRLGLNKNDSEL